MPATDRTVSLSVSAVVIINLIAFLWLAAMQMSLAMHTAAICNEISGVRAELHALTTELRRHRAR